MINNKRLTFLVFLFFCCLPLFSQKSSDKAYHKAVQNADVLFYYDGDYVEAAKQFASLLESNPGNANLQAKLGICYLSIDGKGAEALSLLKAASSNIVAREKDYSDYEDKAPLDTYIYLGNAYQLNNLIDEALEAFKVAKEKLVSTNVFRDDYIDNQIRNCTYAIEMKKNPVQIKSSFFTSWLKDYPGACNPAFSSNDSIFIFTQVTGEQNKIFISFKQGEDWSIPEDITKNLGNYKNLYTNSITADGTFMVISMDNMGDGNLFYTEYTGKGWAKLKNFGKTINTLFFESSGFITPDGKTLYFSSNRNGGLGDLDIWTSSKRNDGTWSNPVNCGNIINTSYNEESPHFDPATNTLIFSSNGHISIGDYDVFTSTKTQNRWSTPVGLPYSLNTTYPNTFFFPIPNGYVTSIYNDQEKSRNIYSLIIDSTRSAQYAVAEGTIKLSDDMPFDNEKVTLLLSCPDTAMFIKTDNEGNFKIELIPGKYTLQTNYEGYVENISNIDIPEDLSRTYFNINTLLVAKQKTGFPADVTPAEVPAVAAAEPGLPEDIVDVTTVPPVKETDYAIEETREVESATSNRYLEINNVLFAFDSYELNEEARREIDRLKEILLSYPELKVEIAGFTDAIGSSAYNIKLSRERVNATVNYLTASGEIPSNRLILKAYGKTNFVAANRNSDGTDNSEGRAFNRRVTFGIVDENSGATIHIEPYTPEHLRLRSSVKYSVILQKSSTELPDNHFSSLDLSGRIFLKPFESENVHIYTVGIFFSRRDANKFLSYAKETGFADAFIIKQYDIPNELTSVERITDTETLPSGYKKYTIQLLATLGETDMSIFKDIEDVKAFEGEDGFVRYIFGAYDTISEAKADLTRFRENGFEDAFVRETIEL